MATGLAVVGALGRFLLGGDSSCIPDDIPPDSTPAIPAIVSPPLLTGSPGAPKDAGPGNPDPILSAASPVVSLDELRQEYMPGRPEEWLLLRMLHEANAQVPEWLSSLLSETSISDEPPYRLAMAFGESDRAWLQRVRASLEHEKRERLRGVDGLSEERLRIGDQVSYEYQQFLATVAARRVAECEACRALFQSDVELRTLEPGSPSARWLEGMIYDVEDSWFWANPDLLPYTDRQYLRASDLAYLRQLGRELRQTMDRLTPEQMAEPGNRHRLRSIVARLADRIAPRK